MDRTEMPASGTHQAQPSAPTVPFGAPVLLITEPAPAPSVTGFDTYRPTPADAPTGPAFDLMDALGRLAERDEHTRPGAATITVLDPVTGFAGVLEFDAVITAVIAAAINDAADRGEQR